MAEADDTGEPLKVSTIPGELISLRGRFSNITPAGYGGGGLVFSARDNTLNCNVSIKKISFADQRSCRQALREVKIVGHMQHENITALYDVLTDDGSSLDLETIEDKKILKILYFVQELLQTDLRTVIASRQLTAGHTKLLMYQLLRGVKYLHSANVVHRDIKPTNLFVDTDSLVLKIGDFGTSRVIDPGYSHSGHLTAHVGTLWYRSPEAILSPADYTQSTDMWSVGCVMAETFLGKPLFPGAHELDQVLQIIDTIHLTDKDWSSVLHVMPNKLMKNHPFRPRLPLRQKLTDVESQAMDMIEALLTFDPECRPSAVDALAHPYFELYSCLEDEPVASLPLHVEHEVDNLPIDVLQRQVAMATHLIPAPPLTSEVTPDPIPQPPVDEDTHTLDEIFQVPTNHDDTTTGRHSPAACAIRRRNSKKKRREETSTVTIENIRNTQNSLRNSPNILEVNSSTADSELPKHKVGESHGEDEKDSELPKHKVGESPGEEDEKDVADCSPRKIREDLELGIYKMMCRANSLYGHGAGKSPKSSSPESKQDSFTQMLNVQVELTENYKEFSQPSPKSASPNSGANQQGTVDSKPKESPQIRQRNNSDSSCVHGATARTDSSRTDSSRTDSSGHYTLRDSNRGDEVHTSKKALKEEMACVVFSRKLILDKIESEKGQAEEPSSHHSGLTNEELDELYRLPTDHLSINRDLTNERLKQKTITVHQPRHTSRHHYCHHGNQDLKERLKEERIYHIEGACGGLESQSPELSDHSEDAEDVLQSLIIDHTQYPHHPLGSIRPPSRSLGDIDISLNRVLLTPSNQGNSVTAPVSQQDPLSSPESPPSPNNSIRAAGARPKKSPKKQRAL